MCIIFFNHVLVQNMYSFEINIFKLEYTRIDEKYINFVPYTSVGNAVCRLALG